MWINIIQEQNGAVQRIEAMSVPRVGDKMYFSDKEYPATESPVSWEGFYEVTAIHHFFDGSRHVVRVFIQEME